MSEPTHQVNVFVFRRRDQGLHYLILRHEPEHEGFWSPLRAPIQPGDTLELAARREAGKALAPPSPEELIDLNHHERFTIGDFDCVEWSVGFGIGERPAEVHLPADYREFLWAPIEQAFPLVEEEASRRAMMKLHFRLAAG